MQNEDCRLKNSDLGSRKPKPRLIASICNLKSAFCNSCLPLRVLRDSVVMTLKQ